MEFNNDIKYYNVDKEEVTKDLSVNPEKGLSESEVKTRREKYGLNEFTPKEEGSFWDDLKESLSEPMIVILIIAAVVSAVIGETHDAIGIVGAIAIGIAIGMITEGRSKKAAEAKEKAAEAGYHVSVGAASGGCDAAAVVKAAEQRMYEDKKRYYMSQGDRRKMR